MEKFFLITTMIFLRNFLTFSKLFYNNNQLQLGTYLNPYLLDKTSRSVSSKLKVNLNFLLQFIFFCIVTSITASNCKCGCRFNSHSQ